MSADCNFYNMTSFMDCPWPKFSNFGLFISYAVDRFSISCLIVDILVLKRELYCAEAPLNHAKYEIPVT